MQRNLHFALLGLGLLCAAALLGGCSSLVLFDPKGPIGDAQRVIITCIRGDKKWILLHLF
jgi:cytochrome o ubiquinol oxidase subunit 2